MEQELNIKVLLPPDYKVDETFLMDVINGLNDRYVPITQITLNGVEKFNNVQGFVKEQKKLDEEERPNE